MATAMMRPCGDFRTTYRADTTMFEDAASRNSTILWIVLLALLPMPNILGLGFEILDAYWMNLLVTIGYLSIAALGLNILVGFTGQISIGHSVFFGFGAFSSVWLSNNFAVPVFLSIPLAALMTAAVGLIFGVPAARIKGLYLAIATLAAQFILEDFFARADWFTGGVAGSLAQPITLFGQEIFDDHTYFLVVLFVAVIMFIAATNMMRTRDGRAFVAVRDHYLSAEIMGVNLTKYRVMSFGVSSFYAGMGGALYAHHLGFVSVEAFTILFSIQFLGMIIIGGLGSILGTILGVTFMVMLPEVMDAGGRALSGSWLDTTLGLQNAINFLKEMAIGLAIVLFLIFEPDGLAHRWKQIKAYWKLYPFSY